jgi:hypothetical protein
MSLKIDVNCGLCGIPMKVPPKYFEKPICHECRINPDRIKSQVTKAIKENFKTTHKVKLDNDDQILSALESVGDAFRSNGGANLMLTEHVENGIDAIEDLIKIKKLKDYEGEIFVKIVEDDELLIITDNGSGIIDPVWIMENPLKSRKTGEAHQKGEFGRGLQGFRGFCQNLTYITLREKPNNSELNHPDHKTLFEEAGKKGIDGSCVKLSLSKLTILTEYELVKIDEFRKYSKSPTGTVAIFSNWLPGEFEELIKDKQKIFDRIQHHFRVPLENNVTRIFLNDDKGMKEIEPREFEAKNDDGVMKELDLYDIPDRNVINPYTGQEIGTIQVRFYKASPNYDHRYKAPFLLIGDRPLGNSVLHDMEHFSHKRILKSPYLTGYVVANFLKPDSLRLSPRPGEELKQFQAHMDFILDDILEPQLELYEAGFKTLDKTNENNKLILQVQTFIKNHLNIKLNLIETSKIGNLILSDDMGQDKTQRISDKEDGDNQGLVTRDGKVEAVILYKKRKYKKGKPKPDVEPKGEDDDNDGDREPVLRYRVEVPSSDGNSTTKVLINPDLTSKDGRIRKREFVGPGLDNYRGKYDRNLSKWDDSKYLVLINEVHPVYLEYEEKRKNSSKLSSEIYSPKQKNLIQESYLWHLIQNCTKDLDNDEKDRTFWEAKYKFFLHKEDE